MFMSGFGYYGNENEVMHSAERLPIGRQVQNEVPSLSSTSSNKYEILK